MKIVDVVVTPFTRQLSRGTAPMGVLTIAADTGVKGSMMFGGGGTSLDTVVPAIVKTVRPSLLGRDPLQRGQIWESLWRQTEALAATVSRGTVAVVDIALWDLAGRAAGLPIHALIGSCHEKLPAYVGNPFGAVSGTQGFVEDLLAQKAKGYRGYKLHSRSAPDLATAIAMCTALRKAAGDGFPLMFDAHAAYGYAGAVKLGLVLQELDFVWFEDPLPPEDIYGHARLKQQLHIPILATEVAPKGPRGHEQWILNHATDMLRGDVINKGGITPLLKIANLADMFGMPFEPHQFGTSCNNIATFNVALAAPNSGWYEVNLPDENFKFGTLTDVDVDAEGFVHAPTGPGLGHELDWALIEQTKTEEIR